MLLPPSSRRVSLAFVPFFVSAWLLVNIDISLASPPATALGTHVAASVKPVALSPGTPRLPCGHATASVFYGVGGHIAQGGPYATRSIADQLHEVASLGMHVYQQDLWGIKSAQRVAQLARAAKSACIAVVPVLVQDFTRANDESAAYAAGQALGLTAAQTLRGLVRYYQVGNECDNLAIVQDSDGNGPNGYDNLRFMKARGAILGMIDGVKQSDPNARILMCSGGWLHTGFLDMLHAGTQPDGTQGHQIPQWDITAWHWYSDMGDITNAHGFNVLQHLHDAYGKPIWITEFGARPTLSEQQAADYLVGALRDFGAHAQTYGIQQVSLYELYDDAQSGGDGNYGLVEHDARTRKPRYEAVRNFIAEYPAQ